MNRLKTISREIVAELFESSCENVNIRRVQKTRAILEKYIKEFHVQVATARHFSKEHMYRERIDAEEEAASSLFKILKDSPFMFQEEFTIVHDNVIHYAVFAVSGEPDPVTENTNEDL